jgi:carbamoyltransferase
MIVLGINETHCATAAVLRDGRIVGCASEERFTRLKNDAGYPRQAIDALLRELGIAPPRSTWSRWPALAPPPANGSIA